MAAQISTQAKAFFAEGGQQAPVSIDELVRQFQTDKPTIAEAMKTYLSFLMASDLTSTDTDAGAGGAAQVRPPAAVASTTYLTIARKVLAAVNSTTVPDSPPSSLTAHAPHEYEVAARLVRKVKEGNGKITSLFGRRYFLALQNWEFIEKLARAQLSSVDAEVLDAFLRGFSSTLLPDGAEGADESLRKLVWSSDLKKTLAQRQEERKQEVAARNARAEAGQNDLDDVKAILTAGGGGESGAGNPTAAGPTITELPGEGEEADDGAASSTMNEIEPVPVRSAGRSDGGGRSGGGNGGGQRLGDGSGAAVPVPLGAVLQDAAAEGEAPVVEHYRMIDGVKTRIG